MAKRIHSEKDMPVPDGPKGLRQRGKGPTYYFLKQYKGKRSKISLGTSLDQARMTAQQIINAMDRGDFKLTEFQSDRTGIVNYLTEAVNRLGIRSQHSPKTRAAYTNRVNQFVAFLADSYPKALFLDDLVPDSGNEYVEWRRAQWVTRSGKSKPSTPKHHPSARTIHDDVRRLRALFRVATENKLIDKNPFQGIHVPVKSNDLIVNPRTLSEKEVKKLLSAAKKYDAEPNRLGAASTFRGMMHDIVQFYLLTGLRKEELIYLPWSHVDFNWAKYGKIEIQPISEPTILLISPSKAHAKKIQTIASSLRSRSKLFANKAQMKSCIAKNYADQEMDAIMSLPASAWDEEAGILRIPTYIKWKQKATPGPIPMIKESNAILLRRKAANTSNSPFVFPHPDNGPLRSDPLPQFKKLLVEANLPKTVRLHDLRHTFAFTLRERGVRLETIMGLMRHANLKETMIYAKYSLYEGAEHLQCLDNFGS
jgi:integrase